MLRVITWLPFTTWDTQSRFLVLREASESEEPGSLSLMGLISHSGPFIVALGENSALELQLYRTTTEGLPWWSCGLSLCSSNAGGVWV